MKNTVTAADPIKFTLLLFCVANLQQAVSIVADAPFCTKLDFAQTRFGIAVDSFYAFPNRQGTPPFPCDAHANLPIRETEKFFQRYFGAVLKPKR